MTQVGREMKAQSPRSRQGHRGHHQGPAGDAGHDVLRPELLNRIDEVVVFHQLRQEQPGQDRRDPALALQRLAEREITLNSPTPPRRTWAGRLGPGLRRPPAQADDPAAHRERSRARSSPASSALGDTVPGRLQRPRRSHVFEHAGQPADTGATQGLDRPLTDGAVCCSPLPSRGLHMTTRSTGPSIANPPTSPGTDPQGRAGGLGTVASMLGARTPAPTHHHPTPTTPDSVPGRAAAFPHRPPHRYPHPAPERSARQRTCPRALPEPQGQARHPRHRRRHDHGRLRPGASDRTKAQWELWTRVPGDHCSPLPLPRAGQPRHLGLEQVAQQDPGQQANWGKKWACQIVGRDKPWHTLDVNGVRLVLLDSVQHDRATPTATSAARR